MQSSKRKQYSAVSTNHLSTSIKWEKTFWLHLLRKRFLQRTQNRLWCLTRHRPNQLMDQNDRKIRETDNEENFLQLSDVVNLLRTVWAISSFKVQNTVIQTTKVIILKAKPQNVSIFIIYLL